MSEEILINITPMESRVAVVENGVLQEVHVERTQRRGIVGNIYKGKVVRVLPGMQAAFVDIGLERAAFIHASEISQREGSAVENITALVHEGQALVVQVTKDPIGTKGARLTTQLSIPSRYLVYMPRSSHVGISLKIEDEAERERLKQVVSDCMDGENIKDAGGFILRTAAEGARAEEILQDIRYLRRAHGHLRRPWPGPAYPARPGQPEDREDPHRLAGNLPEDHAVRRRVDAGNCRPPRTLPGRAPNL